MRYEIKSAGDRTVWVRALRREGRILENRVSHLEKHSGGRLH